MNTLVNKSIYYLLYKQGNKLKTNCLTNSRNYLEQFLGSFYLPSYRQSDKYSRL